MALQRLSDLVFAADEHDVRAKLSRRHDGTSHRVLGGVVSPHRVNGNLHRIESRNPASGRRVAGRSVFFLGNDDATFVIAAMRAHTVRRFIAAALRTLGSARNREAVVGSTAISAGTRVPLFG